MSNRTVKKSVFAAGSVQKARPEGATLKPLRCATCAGEVDLIGDWMVWACKDTFRCQAAKQLSIEGDAGHWHGMYQCQACRQSSMF